METLYIIGNGFDINFGLDTRYSDFYKHYDQLPSSRSNDAIKGFKDGISRYLAQIKNQTPKELAQKGNDINWADLELAMGKYCKNIKAEDFDDFYFEINEKFRSYLLTQDKEFDLSEESRQKLWQNFRNPENNSFFNQNEKDSLINLKQSNKQENIDIINFNYTSTLEQIFNFKGKPIQIGSNTVGFPTNIRSIRHIHRTLKDEEILVGVNDASQINNEEFQKDVNITELLIKPNANNVFGDRMVSQCENLIKKAQLIVLFGVSLGDTDRIWWNHLKARIFSQNCRIIHFVYCPKQKEDDTDHYRRILHQRIRRAWTDIFFERIGIEKAKWDSLRNNVFIVYNDATFFKP